MMNLDSSQFMEEDCEKEVVAFGKCGNYSELRLKLIVNMIEI